MVFIRKLFPFESLIFFDRSTVTAYCILVIVAMFLGFAGWLFIKVRGLNGRVRRIGKGLANKDFDSGPTLKEAWQHYSDSFIDCNGETKTFEDAADYFNEKNLLSKSTNIRLLTSIPSVLVGTGILGTFLGLTLGISDFDTESTDGIKRSIETLLSGMGTAFITSIWGMGLSLLYTFWEKVSVGPLDVSLHRLCYSLNRKYRLGEQDQRELQLQEQRRLFDQYFVYKDEDGNDVKPGNVLRDIYEESGKMAQAIQSFSTDLATKIEAGFQTILANHIDQGVLPALESLRSEIVQLREGMKDPATEMTQSVVSDLKTAMMEMVGDFKDSVSGSAKKEMETLAAVLGQAGASLTTFPSLLEQMTTNLNGNFQSLQESVKQVSEQMLSQGSSTVTQMKEQIERLTNAFDDKIGGLQIGQETLIGEQAKNISASGRLIESLHKSIQELDQLSDKIGGTMSEIAAAETELGRASMQLSSVSESVASSVRSFDSTQQKLADQSSRFIQENGKVLEHIATALDKAQKLSTEYAEKFGVIEAGLRSIFSQIQQGTKEFSNTISDGVDRNLTVYTEKTNRIAEALAGASKAHGDLLEELTDQLDKMRR